MGDGYPSPCCIRLSLCWCPEPYSNNLRNNWAHGFYLVQLSVITNHVCSTILSNITFLGFNHIKKLLEWCFKFKSTLYLTRKKQSIFEFCLLGFHLFFKLGKSADSVIYTHDCHLAAKFIIFVEKSAKCG